MRNEAPVVVLKFGSSVLESETDLPTAVHEIYRWWKEGHQVVAVVSAFGNTTDNLTRRAHTVCNEPDDSLLAALLATGEAASSALLGLALNRAGIPATVFDAEQAGLCTVGPTLNSDLIALNAASVFESLRNGVVVLPGFVGRGERGQPTLLGRGGSDLTALFLAQQLGGVCRLIKDVDGLYTCDPNSPAGSNARRFARISYYTAAKVGGSVVQPKTINFAEGHRLRFVVAAIGSTNGTEVGPYADHVAISEDASGPLRVALLGCGTVGAGVFQRLAALPELFEVVSVGTRNIDRAIHEDVPVRLLTTHLEKLIEQPVDAIIELIGGVEPARALVTEALRLGRHVVTANKALLANYGNELEKLAFQSGATIRYSAAVGGVVPAFEAVRRARNSAELISVSGVLNGSTNFILDELARGSTFSEAVTIAKKRGYTESDPQIDTDGTDAAQKLILLARAAFRVDLPFKSITRKPIDENTKAHLPNNKLRLVAECRRTETGLKSSVTPRELSSEHPLAQVEGVGNRLLIEATNGKTWIVSGKGAGRWPTTEAVIADLFDLRCDINEEKAVCAEECVA
jgi:homoserine dehydrogenase